MKDGSILSIYSHWNNFPEYNGRILRTHYNTREKVAELVDGGDVSCLWTDERFDESADGSYGPNYYSFRGDDCPPRLDANKYDYLAEGEEYAYIYTLKDEWVCYNRNEFGSKMPEVVEIPSGALMV